VPRGAPHPTDTVDSIVGAAVEGVIEVPARPAR
jgi:hypothetical protein